MPGVILSQPLKEATVTSRGKEIYLEDEIGASISIPRDSVVKDAHVGISASFSGPYDMPDDVKSVSPAYLINTNEEVEFSKDVTVRMQHTASVGSPEDCEDLVLLEADSTPVKNRYRFRVSTESTAASFLEKIHFGVMKVRKFFSKLFKIGKKGEGIMQISFHQGENSKKDSICSPDEDWSSYSYILGLL